MSSEAAPKRKESPTGRREQAQQAQQQGRSEQQGKRGQQGQEQGQQEGQQQQPAASTFAYEYRFPGYGSGAGGMPQGQTGFVSGSCPAPSMTAGFAPGVMGGMGMAGMAGMAGMMGGRQQWAVGHMQQSFMEMENIVRSPRYLAHAPVKVVSHTTVA
jgi:hypothetical protein